MAVGAKLKYVMIVVSSQGVTDVPQGIVLMLTRFAEGNKRRLVVVEDTMWSHPESGFIARRLFQTLE